MKHAWNYLIGGICLLTGMSGLSSCGDKNLFDQDAYTKELEENFPVSNINANQTWQTVGTVTANVTVNKDEGATYTIKVYDGDPIVDSKAVMLTKNSIVNGSTWTGTVDYPLADSTLYVCCVDSKARREVKPVKVTTGSSFSVAFGTSSDASTSSSIKSRAISRASYDITDPSVAAQEDVPYSESTVNSMITEATDISTVSGYDIANNGANSHNYYKITGNATYNVTAGSPKAGTKVIVTGTWTPNSQSFNAGIEVIVANGGKIILNSGLTSTGSSGNFITVMPGGIISGAGSITTEGTSIYNGGTINLKQMSYTSGNVMYNAGTLTLSSDLTLNTGADLINYGTTSVSGTIYAPASGYVYNALNASMTAGLIQLVTGATLINHSDNCHFGNATGDVDNANFETTCKMIVDGTFTPKSLIISEGGSVQCKDLVFHYATVNMGPNAILEATNSTTLQGVTINGPTSGSNYAICVFGTILDNGYGMEAFNNLLYVDITSHPVPASKWSWCWFTNDVTTSGAASVVGQGEAAQSIPSGDCSIGYTSKTQGGDTDGSEFTSSYCFEDNYPSAGDYDFNDVVMDVARSVDKKVVTLKVTLRAVGAIKQSGAAIRLVGISPSDVTSISTSTGFSDTAFGSLMQAPGSTGYLTSKDRSSVVIPLFGDAHKAMTGSTTRIFINTEKGSTVYPSKTVTITINAKSTSVAQNISSTTIDPFIYNGTAEIHTYLWKDNAALYSIPQSNSGKFIWAIQVPISIHYPLELVSIEKAYNGFAAWAQQANNSAWYTNFDSTKVY